MRTFLFLLVLVLVVPVQPHPVEAQASLDTVRVEYQLLRQREDWRSLRGVTEGLGVLKGRRVGPDSSTYVSVGGEARTYARRWTHEQWGRLATQDAYVLQRFMLHGSARRSWDEWRLRTFAQLKSGGVVGRDGPVFPTSRDRLGVNQAFLEVGRSLGPDRQFSLRAGRQELHYGAGRMIAVREGPNVRRGFDGVLGHLQSGPWRVDAFVVRSSTTRPGVFDNGRKSGRTLWGVHARRTRSASIDWSAYYMGTARDAAPVNAAFRITRHTIGVRGGGTVGRFQIAGEGAVQAGRYRHSFSKATGPVRAGMMAGRLTYRVPGVPERTMVGVAADWSSGDAASSRAHGTFAAPYPSGRLTGAGSRLGPGNLLNLRPFFGISFPPALRLELRGHFFWRSRSSDGLYAIWGAPIRTEAPTDARYVGTMPEAMLTWTVNRHLTMAVEASRFFTGPVLTRPGHDMTHLGMRVKYRF